MFQWLTISIEFSPNCCNFLFNVFDSTQYTHWCCRSEYTLGTLGHGLHCLMGTVGTVTGLFFRCDPRRPPEGAPDHHGWPLHGRGRGRAVPRGAHRQEGQLQLRRVHPHPEARRQRQGRRVECRERAGKRCTRLCICNEEFVMKKKNNGVCFEVTFGIPVVLKHTSTPLSHLPTSLLIMSSVSAGL